MTMLLIKKTIKFIASYVIYYSGINYLFEKIQELTNRCEIKILAYHNISDVYPKNSNLTLPVSIFEDQLHFIGDNYDVISMDEAIKYISQDKKLNKNKIVLTFDDNYVEYHDIVLPLILKYKMKGIFFVSVEPISSRKPLLVDIIVHSISRTRKTIIDLNELDLGKFKIRTNKDKEAAISNIIGKARSLSLDGRKAVAELVSRKCELEHEKILDKYLTWEQIKNIKMSGLDIGSHTMTHPFLSSLNDNELVWELSESKRQIEEKLETKVNGIAYPYGSTECYHEKTVQIAKKAGYDYACTLISDKKNMNSHELPRKNMDISTMSIAGKKICKPLLAIELSGIADILLGRTIKNRIQ